MLSELKTLAYLFRDWLILLLVATIFFFSVGTHTIGVYGHALTLPWFEGPSLSAKLLTALAESLVPAGVSLVVTTPLAAFVAQVKIALLLAFIAILPIGITQLVRYFGPAMYARERRVVRMLALPAAGLFALGAWFAYVFVIPPTFSILYGYADTLGATSYFALDALVGFAVSLMAACGIMFTLPVGMVALARTGVVGGVFWRQRWRGALVTFLIVSAILTPDGSGVTMVLLAAPMAALYGAGIIASGT